MIRRFKSRFQDGSEISAVRGTRAEKIRRFQATFSLVYWMVTLLVLAYAFSVARIGDRPLLIALALVAATINFVFLHFRPHRLSLSHRTLAMVVVTSVFALLLVFWTGPLDSPFFATLLLLVLTASLVLSRVVAVVAAISLAFLGVVGLTSQLGTPSSLLTAGVKLAMLWVMAYVEGFLSQELTLKDGELSLWELEQRVRNATQGARDVFAGTINDLKNALDEVLERASFALRIPAAGIFLVDEEKRGLILTSYTGLPSDLAKLVAVQRLAEPGAGLASRAALQRKPFVLDDLITDPLVEEFREAILLSGWRSTACIPMVSRGRVVGVVQLFADEMEFFNESRLAALGALTNELGLSIDNVSLAEEEKKRRTELAALHGAAKTMSSTQTLNDAVHSALDAIGRLGFPHAKVLLLDERRRQLVPQTSSPGAAAEAMTGTPLGKGAAGQAAQSGEPVLIPDVSDLPLADGNLEGTRSQIAVPLKVKGNLIGVLNIGHEQPNAFGDKDIRVLTSFANQAAIAIDNARLYEAEKTRTEHLGAWRDYSARIQTAQTESEVLAALLHYLDRLVAPNQSVVYRPVPEGKLLEVTQHVGLPGRCGRDSRVGAASCIAYRTGKAFRFDGADELPCPVKSSTEGGDRYLCLPMVVGGSTIGVIHLDSLHEAYWSEERTELARGFVDYAAPILQNVRYFKQLQQRAIQDELTGLHNRRFLEGHLQKQLAMAPRYEQPLAVLMLDIDLFKTINDRFGHDAGDRVLRSFSVNLSQTIRASDVVARWGGEEFVVVLPSTIGHAAKALAEKIRKSIEALSFEEQVPGLGGITVSIGTAAYPDDGTTEEILLKSADLALYRAKQRGRNRVEAAAV